MFMKVVVFVRVSSYSLLGSELVTMLFFIWNFNVELVICVVWIGIFHMDCVLL